MVKIRKAKLKDVSEIAEMWADFMKYHDAVVTKSNSKLKVWLEKRKDGKELFKKYVKKSIRSRNAVINVAEDKGKLVAYSLLKIESNIPVFKIGKLGQISDLYVSKDYRGKGISTKFKNLAVKWFKEKGLKHAMIRVYPYNRIPYSIYKKWGFTDFHIDMRKKL